MTTFAIIPERERERLRSYVEHEGNTIISKGGDRFLKLTNLLTGSIQKFYVKTIFVLS